MLHGAPNKSNVTPAPKHKYLLRTEDAVQVVWPSELREKQDFFFFLIKIEKLFLFAAYWIQFPFKEEGWRRGVEIIIASV